MDEKMTLMKALNTHLRLSGETMKDFAVGMSQLTDKDRAELAAEFMKEPFNYSIIQSSR